MCLTRKRPPGTRSWCAAGSGSSFRAVAGLLAASENTTSTSLGPGTLARTCIADCDGIFQRSDCCKTALPGISPALNCRAVSRTQMQAVLYSTNNGKHYANSSLLPRRLRVLQWTKLHLVLMTLLGIQILLKDESNLGSFADCDRAAAVWPEESIGMTAVSGQMPLAAERQADYVSRHIDRLKRLDVVAKQPTHLLEAHLRNTLQLDIDCTTRSVGTMQLTIKAAMAKTSRKWARLRCSHFWCSKRFRRSAENGNGWPHPDSGAAHLAYEAAKPCLKGDYAPENDVKLMWAVLWQTKFEMWRPTTNILQGARPLPGGSEMV